MRQGVQAVQGKLYKVYKFLPFLAKKRHVTLYEDVERARRWSARGQRVQRPRAYWYTRVELRWRLGRRLGRRLRCGIVAALMLILMLCAHAHAKCSYGMRVVLRDTRASCVTKLATPEMPPNALGRSCEGLQTQRSELFENCKNCEAGSAAARQLSVPVEEFLLTELQKTPASPNAGPPRKNEKAIGRPLNGRLTDSPEASSISHPGDIFICSHPVFTPIVHRKV